MMRGVIEYPLVMVQAQRAGIVMMGLCGTVPVSK